MSVNALLLALGVDAEMISQATRESTDAGAFTSVELSRARLGVSLDLPNPPIRRAGADLRFEAVRSASPDSVIGVVGDSLIVRVAVAQLVGEDMVGPLRVEARAGLVEESHRRAISLAWDLRLVDSPLIERAAFGHTADLGAALGVGAFGERLLIEAAVTNGEGPAEVEQDDRKNVTVTLSGVPFRALEHELRLSVHLQKGTRGAGGTRNDAVSGLFALVGNRLGLGVEYTRLSGHLDRGDREADALGVYVRGEVWDPWLGLFARFDRLDTDFEARGSVQKRLGGGVYGTLVDAPETGRFRLAAALQRDTGGAGAAPRPFADTTRVLLSAAFDWEGSSPLSGSDPAP